MADKKKNRSKAKPSIPEKGKVPQKPVPEKKLRLNLGTKLKEEIVGILMMAISVLLILAVVSHHPEENPSSILDKWRRGDLQNMLGVAGAYVSYGLVTYTFGYAFVAIPILFLVYGWLFFTHKSIFLVNPFAFYMVTLMVIVSGWLAVPGTLDQAEHWETSGLIGGLLARQLYLWLGGFGSVAVWSVFSLIWVIMVTRVSVADLIPAVQSIFLTSYRATADTLSRFKDRQSELLEREGATTETEKPLIPEYLQENAEKDTTQAGISVHFEKPADIPEPNDRPDVKKQPITGTDLGLDTQFMRDLKAIGHVEKRFSINASKLTELESVQNEADGDVLTKDTTEEKIEPKNIAPEEMENDTAYKPTEAFVPEADESIDVSNVDFKDLAKSVFDEEHGHIDIDEPEPEPKPVKTRVSKKAEPDEPVASEEESSEEAEPDTKDILAEDAIAINQAETPSAKSASRAKAKPAEKKEEPEVDFDHENQQARKRYKYPSIDLLEETKTEEKLTPEEIQQLDNKINQIIAKLSEFGIDTKVVSTEYGGPVVAIYQLELPSGLKISKITGLEDELALALKVKSVRMVPVTSKGTIQVEIPKPKAAPVLIRSLFEDTTFRNAKQKYKLGLALGKTIDGHIHFEDLAKMPHLLIAGTTGSGKSVGINSIITSILYQFDPSEVKFIMVDPKKVELALYRRLKNHHLIALRNPRGEIIEDVVTKPENAKLMLKALVDEMEERYEKLADASVRNIEDYNRRWHEGRMPESEIFNHHKMEYIVAIIDELADLMMTAPREVETSITRLAQMARAVGIHLVVATQRPSVDVLTGLIKANFPARIAYAVRSKIDSRTILDMGGAELLLGKGDMLFMPPGQNPIRIQNAFTSTQETESIIDYISKMPAFPRKDFVVKEEAKEDADGDVDTSGFDELFNQALEIVVKHNQGSASLLQRRLAVGYARAARLVDQLEKAGVVSPPDGAKPRQVLITEDQIPMYMV